MCGSHCYRFILRLLSVSNRMQISFKKWESQKSGPAGQHRAATARPGRISRSASVSTIRQAINYWAWGRSQPLVKISPSPSLSHSHSHSLHQCRFHFSSLGWFRCACHGKNSSAKWLWWGRAQMWLKDKWKKDSMVWIGNRRLHVVVLNEILYTSLLRVGL